MVRAHQVTAPSGRCQVVYIIPKKRYRLCSHRCSMLDLERCLCSPRPVISNIAPRPHGQPDGQLQAVRIAPRYGHPRASGPAEGGTARLGRSGRAPARSVRISVPRRSRRGQHTGQPAGLAAHQAAQRGSLRVRDGQDRAACELSAAAHTAGRAGLAGAGQACPLARQR